MILLMPCVRHLDRGKYMQIFDCFIFAVNLLVEKSKVLKEKKRNGK